jgi:hypothetical protein
MHRLIKRLLALAIARYGYVAVEEAHLTAMEEQVNRLASAVCPNSYFGKDRVKRMNES